MLKEQKIFNGVNNKLLFLIIGVLILIGCAKQIDSSENNITSTVDENQNNIALEQPVSSAEQIADKLEVYYFHRTARCYSCKTIGQYVRETMEQKYGMQISNGIIDFREINIDLPENKDAAKRYQASGSSLFINRVINGQDNIEQDANVWKLLGNESQFKSYLENKLNSYLPG
ncbi:MAG: nitrophenyl compound nitroreductase subunit ArsF family protein [Candidatus Falkowbacteria bacterium]